MARDGEALLIGGKRARLVIAAQFQIADLVERDRDVVLPLGIGLVGVGQAAERGKALLERGKRAGRIALHHLHVADLAETDGNVALPERVALIERGNLRRMARPSS